MSVKIKFKSESPLFELPQKTFEAACYDVKVTRIENKNNLVICYLGFSTEIPENWKGVIVPRSSQTKTKWAMLNSPGQVDCDYRGEWQVRFTYLGDDDIMNPVFPFQIGDRVAQIYFEPVYQPIFILYDELSVTQRGPGGFGSSGK